MLGWVGLAKGSQGLLVCIISQLHIRRFKSDIPAKPVDSGTVDVLVTGTCIDMLALAELVETAAVEVARLDSLLEVDASSSEDLTLADGREDAVAMGVCERSEGLSSCRRTAD